MHSKHKHSRRVTSRGGGGRGRGGLSCLFFKTEKKCSNFGKNAVVIFIYVFHFPLKMLFYQGIQENSPKFFPVEPFFDVLQIVCSRMFIEVPLFSETSPALKKSLLRALNLIVLKKMNSCFVVDTLIEFLVLFTTKDEKKLSRQSFLERHYSEKCQIGQSPFLVRKFQVAGLQICLEGTSSPLLFRCFVILCRTVFTDYITSFASAKNSYVVTK